MRLMFMATILVALVGCATTLLSDDVKPYVGQNVRELVARLGRPTGRREATEDRIYVWSADSEGVLPITAGGEGARTRTMTAHYECTLEVTASAQDIIESYEIEGSNAGCAAFRRHLMH